MALKPVSGAVNALPRGGANGRARHEYSRADAAAQGGGRVVGQSLTTARMPSRLPTVATP